MTTLTRRAQLNRRSLIGYTTLNDHILGYAEERMQRLCRSVYSEDAVFGTPYNVAPGNGIFTVSGTQHCTDGIGNIMNPNAMATYFANVPFENSGGVKYDVAMKRSLAPARTLDNTGVVINPGTGIPEYLCRQEIIGEVADPNAVIDNGGSITLVVDSVCEAGVTHAGRKCLVYLKQPSGLSENVALQELTVAWAGGQNRVTTADLLGQSSVATDAALYEVALLGPTIRRNTSLDIAGYFFLGELTGGNPASWEDEQAVVESDLSEINADLAQFSNTVLVEAKGGRKQPRPGGGVFGCAAAASRFTGGGFEADTTRFIYTVGGADDGAYTTMLDTHYGYDVDNDSWFGVTPLPYGAYAHVGYVSHGDLLYACGGYEATGPSVVDEFWSYDPQDDTWTELEPLPITAAFGAMVSLNDRIYYLGGTDQSFVALDTCYSYNPDTNLWSSIAALPTATGKLSAFVYNGRILVWSGLNTKDLWEYDPDANAWSDLADGDQESRFGFAWMANGVLHVGNGLAGPGGAVRKHMAYSRINDEWIYLDPPAMPHMYNGCSAVADGVGFWIGGEVHNGIEDTTVDWNIACDLRGLAMAENTVSVSHTGRRMLSEQYAAANETTGLMPTTLGLHMACVAARCIWLSGGLDSAGNPNSNMWRYYLDTETWDKHTDFGETRCQGLLVEHEEERRIYLLGGHDNGGSNVGDGWSFDMDGLVWDAVTTASGNLFVSQAGPGTRIGNKIFWSCGNQTLVVPTVGDDVRAFDVLLNEHGPIFDLGAARARRQSISFVTQHVGLNSLLKDTDYKVWAIGGVDGADVVRANMAVYDVEAGFYATPPLLGIVTSDTARGNTDGRSVVFACGNRTQTFGETGRDDDIICGANSLLHEYQSAIVLFEGRVYQMGGHNNIGTFGDSRMSMNTYGGAGWIFYPKNWSRGEQSASIGAPRGDIYGFYAWNNRHVYEAAVVGVVAT